MSTQPRMSAPIGRLRIATAEGGRRRGSGAGRWRPAESPRDPQMQEAEEALGESAHPPFYPFPLRVTDDEDR